MRMILQRGRACVLLGVSIGVAVKVRAQVKIERPRERPMRRTNDGIATELAVSQYIITTALSPHPSIPYRSSFASPPLPIPPPEHLVQVRVRPRKEPPQVLNKIVRRPRVAPRVPRTRVIQGMLPEARVALRQRHGRRRALEAPGWAWGGALCAP